MVRLYGVTASRITRCLWLAEELGIDYEQIPIDFRKGETATSAYRSINPNAKVPAMVDGDVNLWESMAINFYLADQYQSTLYPATAADRGRALQWSFWGMVEVEKPLLTALMHRFIFPLEQRDESLAEQAEHSLQALFSVLEQSLIDKIYLLGQEFSIADLNLAAIMSWSYRAKIDMSAYPNITGWLDRCLTRPAWQAVMRKMAV